MYRQIITLTDKDHSIDFPENLYGKQLEVTVKEVKDKSVIDSPALPGNPMSLKAFKEWISQTENSNTISVKEARQKWAGKRKQLQKLSR